jgi:hypothetical protein
MGLHHKIAYSGVNFSARIVMANVTTKSAKKKDTRELDLESRPAMIELISQMLPGKDRGESNKPRKSAPILTHGAFANC